MGAPLFFLSRYNFGYGTEYDISIYSHAASCFSYVLVTQYSLKEQHYDRVQHKNIFGAVQLYQQHIYALLLSTEVISLTSLQMSL